MNKKNQSVCVATESVEQMSLKAQSCSTGTGLLVAQVVAMMAIALEGRLNQLAELVEDLEDPPSVLDPVVPGAGDVLQDVLPTDDVVVDIERWGGVAHESSRITPQGDLDRL